MRDGGLLVLQPRLRLRPSGKRRLEWREREGERGQQRNYSWAIKLDGAERD